MIVHPAKLNRTCRLSEAMLFFGFFAFGKFFIVLIPQFIYKLLDEHFFVYTSKLRRQIKKKASEIWWSSSGADSKVASAVW